MRAFGVLAAAFSGVTSRFGGVAGAVVALAPESGYVSRHFARRFSRFYPGG